MKFRVVALISIILLLQQHLLKAQTLPVGVQALEDYYRRSQLVGVGDSTVSFTVRPVFQNPQYGLNFHPDSLADYYIKTNNAYSKLKRSKSSFMLLPINLQTQINTSHNYGWNDGPVIPAKGLQTYVSAGFFAKFGILSIQLQPEFVYAANTDFDTFNKNHDPVILARYYDIYNNVDLPVRFGNSAYTKAYWGQSSIRLSYKSVSIGLSAENLWWGPGIRNSLLMSNSAPGFKHLTFNTTRPIKTAIGSFEGQLIAGRLEGSGYNPLDSGKTYFGQNLYVPKPNDWRYLSGFVITWQPKWVSGLFLGLARSAQVYHNNLNGIKSYLPFFSPFKTNVADQAVNRRDEYSSVFARWLWPQEHAEVYFEYGINNNTNSVLNSILEPQDARAYIFGFRKMLPFNKSRNENILISFEATQLAETNYKKTLSGVEWYVNPYIRQGYTNKGQNLGAGIGPGANLQTLDISWVKGLKKIGLQFERYLHNDDFYYYAFNDSQDIRRHWVDLSLSLTGEWNYQNFIFNAKITPVKSLNYQWYLKQNIGDTYFVNGAGASNLQAQLGLTYRF